MTRSASSLPESRCARTVGARKGPDEAVYLHPGQLFASTTPTIVRIILGSCVAVCLWDSTALVGGVNHYLLPYWVGNGQASPRFGNVAIDRLIERLLALGAIKNTLTAKIFGGACVLKSFQNGQHLGERNAELARQVLSSHGIPLISEDTGGDRGRKVIFHTNDGAAWVRRL